MTAGDEGSRSPAPADSTPNDATLTAGPTKAARGGPDAGLVLAERYRLLQKIGQGGMGEVWEAEQLEPVRRRVAVKVIKRGMDTRQVVARFEAERQALALMNHPNVARVYDAGETPRGRPFFVMELVRGEPITTFCDRSRATTRERVELLREVCMGVQHAHQKGLIHRDLKPSNVLVHTETDGRATPKIIDFGVAKATNQHLTERTLFTEMGQLIGTPEYMSPEQAEMTGLDIDTRTDVYSLGVILYELLAGALPFEPSELRKAGLSEIQRRIREEEPLKPSARASSLGGDSAVARLRRTELQTLVKRLRGDLDLITMKALEKERTRRYASPSELGDDLARYLGDEPILAAAPSASYRARKFVVRHRAAVLTAAAILVALVVGFIGTTLGFLRALRAEKRAVAALEETVAERDRAEQARDEVAEVVSFLVEMFEAADPGVTLDASTTTARQMLERASERIETELEDRPITRSRLLLTLGDVHESLGLYDMAQGQFEQALALRRSELGATHPETAVVLSELSSLAYTRANWQESVDLADDSIAIFREHYGDGHPETLGAVSDKTIGLSMLGRHDEAVRLAREVVDAARLAPDLDPAQLEGFVRRLAIYLQEQGENEESLALYEESLDLSREIYGDVSYNVAIAMDNLAILHDQVGNIDRAEELYRGSLAMLRRVFGDTHPEVAQTMGNVAEFLAYTKGPSDHGEPSDFAEAEQLHRDALEINRSFRPEHPFTGDNLATLSDLAMKRRSNLSQAESLVSEALRIYRLSLREEDDKLLRARVIRAEILAGRGELEASSRELRDVWPLIEGSSTVSDEIEIRALEQLIAVSDEQGREDDAAEYRGQLERVRAGVG